MGWAKSLKYAGLSAAAFVLICVLAAIISGGSARLGVFGLFAIPMAALLFLFLTLVFRFFPLGKNTPESISEINAERRARVEAARREGRL